MTRMQWAALSDCLDEARRQAAADGGRDVVVLGRDGREIWREHVDRLGHAHPVHTHPHRPERLTS